MDTNGDESKGWARNVGVVGEKHDQNTESARETRESKPLPDPFRVDSRVSRAKFFLPLRGVPQSALPAKPGKQAANPRLKTSSSFALAKDAKIRDVLRPVFDPMADPKAPKNDHLQRAE